MNVRFRLVEALDYRVLGAVRFIDAGTGQQVDRPLEVEAPGVRWIRNRRNLYIVADAPGLSELTAAFEYPDPAPDIDPVTVAATVRDPAARYLARSFSFDLPRDADPANADDAASLFQPVAVLLYPSPTASAVAGWAALRAKVADEASGAPVEGALIRVVKPGADPADDKVLARGLSDERGEAFVPIPGIPLMTWSDEESAVLANSVNLRIEAYADPEAPRPVDPDALEDDRAALPFDELASVPVKAGANVTASLRIRPRTP
jgi:hypothetical protein